MDVKGMKIKPTRWNRYHYFNTVEVGDLGQIVGKKANYYGGCDFFNGCWRMNGKVISKVDDDLSAEVYTKPFAEIEFWNNGKKQTRSFDKYMRCTEKLVDEYDVEYHFYWWILPYQAECYQKVRNWYWKFKEPRTPAEIREEIAEARMCYDGSELEKIIGRIMTPNTETLEPELGEDEF